MPRPGPHNDLTDVAGLVVGSHTDLDAVCGTTVVLCPDGAVGGVDVRGSAPGTRETDLLDPVNLVDRVDAVVLSGGSVYGLAAMSGAASWLAEHGRGFPLGDGQVAPIVPGAVLFDLGRGPSFVPPIGPEWGRAACLAATDGPIDQGSVGAGAGALAGGVKGGLGSASLVLDCGLTAAALAAVNSLGVVIDPATGRLWEERLAQSGELGPSGSRAVAPPPWPPGQAGQNTTIAVVATDATLNKAQATKMAQMAHDGLARAIRPAHTMFDGDTIFCLATGKSPLMPTPGFFGESTAQTLNDLGAALADCLTRAIMRAVVQAVGLGGLTAWRDLPER